MSDDKTLIKMIERTCSLLGHRWSQWQRFNWKTPPVVMRHCLRCGKAEFDSEEPK